MKLPLALFLGVCASAQASISIPSTPVDVLAARYATIQRAIDSTMDADAVKRLNAQLLKVRIELDQAEARQTVEEENRWFAWNFCHLSHTPSLLLETPYSSPAAIPSPHT